MMYLIELTGVNASGTPTVFRYGPKTFCTQPTDTPPDTVFEGYLHQPGLLKRDLYASNQTTGRSQIGFGVVELLNPNGELDDMLNYAFDGQPVRIYAGPDDATAFGAFTLLLSTTLDQPTFTDAAVTLRLRDYLYALDVPLQSTKYAGSNVLPLGAEGVEGDLKGKPKPLLFGRVLNLAPVQVNTAKLMYQVHAGPVASVAVYDRGVLLATGTAHASYAALESATPAAGAVDTWLGGGLFRLGATPTGQVTCDARQSTPANHTAAQLIKAVALQAGIAAARISAADVAALDAVQPAVLGVWVDAEAKPLDVIDKLALSVGAWVATDAAGILRMGRLKPPTVLDDSGVVLTPRDTLSVAITPSADTERGIPAWRVSVNYARLHTVQKPADLAASVTQARVAELGQEVRTATASNAAVQTPYPLAPAMTRETQMVSASDADAETARLLSIYSVQRRFYSVTTTLASTIGTAGAVDLHDVVTLVHDRFGLEAGKLLRVLSLQTDYAAGTVTLTLWG